MTTTWNLQNDVVRLILQLLDRPQAVEVQRLADGESYVAFGKGQLFMQSGATFRLQLRRAYDGPILGRPRQNAD